MYHFISAILLCCHPVTTASASGFDWWKLLACLGPLVAVGIYLLKSKNDKKSSENKELAEQRFGIFELLQDLWMHYYALLNPLPGMHPSSNIDYVSIKKEVRLLLYKPTIMSEDEVRQIYRAVARIPQARGDKARMEAVESALKSLESNLKSNLRTIMNEVEKEHATELASTSSNED